MLCQFCSSCGDVGKHLRCTKGGCPIFMCVGNVEGTMCIRQAEIGDNPWVCPIHNVPNTIKVWLHPIFIRFLMS
jgi:hypothetical protein